MLRYQKRWKSFAVSCEEEDVAEWFVEELEHVEFMFPFNVNKGGPKFAIMVLGYLPINENELGLARIRIGCSEGCWAGFLVRISSVVSMFNRSSGHSSRESILHRDISIGNILVSEDEDEGFLIDLDHVIQENSGAKKRAKVFTSIRLLLQEVLRKVKDLIAFMDDLKLVF